MGSLTILFCTLAVCLLVQAQVVQDDWLFPSKPDLFQTIPIGLAISISWDSNLQTWFQTYAPAASVTNVDLWVTDFNDHIFTHQIGTGVDVSHAGTFPWTCEVPSSELAVTNEWVFRFIASNETAASNTGQISSPGFYLSNDTSATTTASSTTSTPAPASSTTALSASTTTASITSSAPPGSITSSSTSSSSAAASSSSSSSSSSSLSTGAKAGIAIAAVAGAFILVGAGWFLARRRQRRNQSNTGGGGENPQRPPAYGGMQPANEKKYSSYSGPEIPSHRAELEPGLAGQPYHQPQHFAEMDGQSRPEGRR